MPDSKSASHDWDTSQLVSHEDKHRKRFHRWQRFHIALFIGSFLCSLAGILAFGLLLKNFDQFCPLFADPRVRWDGDEQRYVFDVNNSTSGSLETCRFCLFTTVASFIYAFLWVWIFCSFFGTVTAIPKEQISAPWKVVPPAVLLTCLFSSLMLVCAILVTVGQATFCASLERQMRLRCSDAQGKEWRPGKVEMSNFYTLFSRSEFAMWLAAAFWFLNSILLCGRCVVRPKASATAVAASDAGSPAKHRHSHTT